MVHKYRIPLAWSLREPLVAFLDLNDLLSTLVVARCEWLVTADGILESPPALNRKGSVVARLRGCACMIFAERRKALIVGLNH